MHRTVESSLYALLEEVLPYICKEFEEINLSETRNQAEYEWKRQLL